MHQISGDECWLSNNKKFINNYNNSNRQINLYYNSTNSRNKIWKIGSATVMNCKSKYSRKRKRSKPSTILPLIESILKKFLISESKTNTFKIISFKRSKRLNSHKKYLKTIRKTFKTNLLSILLEKQQIRHQKLEEKSKNHSSNKR